jgi:hypothetical protein
VVVDGLGEIPKEDAHLRDQIVALLPRGLTQFKFLCSSGLARTEIASLDKLRRSSLPLSPFTPGEALLFFGSQVLPSSVDELYAVSKGVPGELATFKRLLDSGTDPKHLIETLPTTQPQLFEIEWNAIDDTDQLQMEALAILVHDRTKHTLDDLAAILDVSRERIDVALRPLGPGAHEE